MTPYIEPTAEQIAQAQAAGDAAYAEAQRNDASLATCYDAYRAAYEAVRDDQEKTVVMVQHIDQTVEVHPDWIVNPAVPLPEAQQQADEKMAEYGDWQENAKDWNDIKGDLAL